MFLSIFIASYAIWNGFIINRSHSNCQRSTRNVDIYSLFISTSFCVRVMFVRDLPTEFKMFLQLGHHRLSNVCVRILKLINHQILIMCSDLVCWQFKIKNELADINFTILPAAIASHCITHTHTHFIWTFFVIQCAFTSRPCQASDVMYVCAWCAPKMFLLNIFYLLLPIKKKTKTLCTLHYVPKLRNYIIMVSFSSFVFYTLTHKK